MCKMWERIQFGAKWRLGERTALAMRGIDLNNVKSIQFSFDPFDRSSHSLRVFWFLLSSPYVQRTNPAMKIMYTIRNDRRQPYFSADLSKFLHYLIASPYDGKKLLFRSKDMHVMDLVMTFNRLLGNPELGKSGIRPLPKID